MADPIKVRYAVDASKIDIKPLLEKEFLELSMRAISSANPNENKSWFTPESLEKGLKTFKNKPILGFFENEDFVSHNGQWNEDSETGMAYWDTLGTKGERILGLIRSEDEVKIVKDENGLSWICLTCALWTHYSYKQVKRLLKDAKRAKENGGPTKYISVEVDITDYEELPNGIMKINDFNLEGITILGSRKGIKVEPGIEGAELSVVDVTGNEFFAKQQRALCMAYEKLDSSKDEKEGNGQVNEENKTIVDEQEEVSTPTVTKEVEAAAFENGSNSATVDENPADNSSNNSSEVQNEEVKQENFEEQKEEKDVQEQESTDAQFCAGQTSEEIHDVTYLINELASTITHIEWVVEYYKDLQKCQQEHGEENKNLATVINLLTRIKKQAGEDISDLSELLKDLASEINEETANFETEIAAYSLKSLFEKCKELEAENNKMSEVIKKDETEKFLASAKEIINSVDSLGDRSQEFYDKCVNGEINSLDDLKTKIALVVTFELKKVETQKPVVQKETIETPVVSPDTHSFEQKKDNKKAQDKWAALKAYNGEEQKD